MIAEVHYTDEGLISLLEAGDEEAIKRNPHLATCVMCREGLDQYRDIVTVLRTETPWDVAEAHEEPDTATIASLRTFASDLEREDREAEAYVAELLAGSRETWMPRLRAHPEWRTVGVVRKLAALSYPTLDKMPPDAVEITNLAVEIAEHLVPSNYLRDTVAHTRGDAWRERAYALFYVGKFHESLTACDRADSAFSECTVDEYDQARVGVIRALSLRPLDRLKEASALAADAARVFAGCGDTERMVAAAITGVQMQVKANDYAGAVGALRRISDEYGDTLPVSARAILEGNLGYCYRHLSDVDASIRHYQFSIALLNEIGSVTEALRNRWNVAAMLATSGRTSSALNALSQIQAEFDSLGMASESSVVALDIIELYLIEKRFEDAEMLCRQTYKRFEASGLAMTTRAVTAIGYLQEAVRSRAATTTLVRHVREYVRRLPEEPNLLFAPPLL